MVLAYIWVGPLSRKEVSKELLPKDKIQVLAQNWLYQDAVL